MLPKCRILSTVLTDRLGINIDCVAFSISNEGQQTITVLGHTLTTGQKIPFNYCGMQYQQKLEIDYTGTGTIKVVINQAVQNC